MLAEVAKIPVSETAFDCFGILLYIMKTTLEQTLSSLLRDYGTSALFLTSAAGAAPGSYIQLMEHPTRRMTSYVLKVNKNFATICLMLPATELNDECPMIEVEKIRLSKFSMEFVSRVLSREYKHIMIHNVLEAHYDGSNAECKSS